MHQKTEHRSKSSGFASMDRHKQREIARKGGMAAHQKGTAHEFTAQEARDAGRKGGQQVSSNRSHMIEIGRLGGRRSAERRRNRQAEPKTRGGDQIQAETATESRKVAALVEDGEQRAEATSPQVGGVENEAISSNTETQG